jgi:WD40 repeat protein
LITTKKKGEHWVTALTNLNYNRFAIGAGLSSIEIWEGHNDAYKCIDRLTKHKSRVTSLLYNCKRNVLISGSTDYTINIWNMKEYRCIETIKTYGQIICLLSLHSGYFASGSNDGRIKIYDIDTYDCVNTFIADSYCKITCLQLLKDYRIVSATYNGKINIYNY